MKKILYIHGLGSGINSSTLNDIRDFFDKKYEVHGIEVNENPYESVKKIQNYVDNNKIDIVIGCSLGGFYSAYINAPYKFLINPAFQIINIIKDKIGFGVYEYFCKREDGNTYYTLDQNVIDNFDRFMGLSNISNNIYSKNSWTIFSAIDDFVEAEYQLRNISFASANKFNLLVSNSFKHRINNYILNVVENILWNIKH